jgi:predicted glycosyl hydrolase (DUF1957 family)
MKWINFLHIYQPANATGGEIREASEKSYLRIIRGLEEHPNVKFTINITGCLFSRWEELGYDDLISRIVALVNQGKIELTGSAAYHPFLPLIHKKEIKKQIIENEVILQKYFGLQFKPKGFFIPEMAYDSSVARIIKKMGYEWIILDEISYDGKLGRVDTNKVYKDKYSGLKIVLRFRKYSHGFFPDKYKNIKNTDTVITATDGELYGLRHEDPTAEFEKMLKDKNLETVLISEFISESKDIEKYKPIKCSWESTEEDIKKNRPYVLWYNKDNKTQMMIWKLANLVYKIVDKYKDDKNNEWARWHLVRGLASCTFWWASDKDFSDIFGPQAWNPDEIEKRVNELVKAVRSLEESTELKTKIKIENMALDIKKIIWQKHWRLKHESKK